MKTNNEICPTCGQVIKKKEVKIHRRTVTVTNDDTDDFINEYGGDDKLNNEQKIEDIIIVADDKTKKLFKKVGE